MSPFGTSLSTTTLTSMACRIGVVECSNSDGDVENNKQKSLEIIALLILKESSDSEDGENKHDEVKNRKVQVETLVKAPANNNGKGRVEEGSLKGSTKDVRHCQVDLIVPGLINSRQMLCQLLNQWDENKTHERIADIPSLYNKLNLHDKDDGGPGNESHRDNQGNNALGQSKLGLGLILVLVSVLVLVLFKYSIVDTVVGTSLEEDVDEVRDDEKNRNDA